MISSFWSRRIDELIGLARVDDRDDRHVAVADDESHVLIRNLPKGAEAFHALRPIFTWQHVGKPYSREDFVTRKRGFQQQETRRPSALDRKRGLSR
jgi:hypothetical protein